MSPNPKPSSTASVSVDNLHPIPSPRPSLTLPSHSHHSQSRTHSHNTTPNSPPYSPNNHQVHRNLILNNNTNGGSITPIPIPIPLDLTEKEKKLIREAFALFDTDGDGSVTHSELSHVMETLFNRTLTDDEVATMVGEADTDGNGEVSFEEFKCKVGAIIRGLKDGTIMYDPNSCSDRNLDPSGTGSNNNTNNNNNWLSLTKLISAFSGDVYTPAGVGVGGGGGGLPERTMSNSNFMLPSNSDNSKNSGNTTPTGTGPPSGTGSNSNSTLTTSNHTSSSNQNQSKKNVLIPIPSPLKNNKLKNQEKKVLSHQHDAMVAHFNLRRLSLDMDEDELAALANEVNDEINTNTSKWSLTALIGRPWNPDTPFRRTWEFIILLLVLFQAIYIPFTVSFAIVHDMWSTWYLFDMFADAFFMTDLVMMFNVALNTPNSTKLVYDRKAIAGDYLKGWFLLDLAASVPFDTIISAFDGNKGVDGENGGGASAAAATSLLKGFKLPRLLRLLKIMRLMRLVKMAKIRPEIIWWFQYSRHANLIRLGTLIFGVVIVVHYMTCIFFPVMKDVWFTREDCEDYDATTYERVLLNNVNYETDWDLLGVGLPYRGCMSENTTVYVQYFTAFYNSMILIQGEHIDPKSVEEKIYCSFVILMGSLLLAMIFGNVSMYISNFSANTTAYQRKMEYLFESMNRLELPQNLKKRIIMYYDHIWKEYKSLDGHVHGFLPELSKQLGSEVHLYLRTNLVLTVPFLRQCSPEVVQRLVTALKTEVFLPNDYIVRKGVPGEEMYLISRGICEVTVTDFANRMQHFQMQEDIRMDEIKEKNRRSEILNAGKRGGGGVAGMERSIGGVGGRGRRRSSIFDAMKMSLSKVNVTGGYGNRNTNANANATTKAEAKASGTITSALVASTKKTKLDNKGHFPQQRSSNGMLLTAKNYTTFRVASTVKQDDHSNSVTHALAFKDKSNTNVRTAEEEGVDRQDREARHSGREGRGRGGEIRRHSIDKMPREFEFDVKEEIRLNDIKEKERSGKEGNGKGLKITTTTPTTASETLDSKLNKTADIPQPRRPNGAGLTRVGSRLGKVDFQAAFPLQLQDLNNNNGTGTSNGALPVFGREGTDVTFVSGGSGSGSSGGGSSSSNSTNTGANGENGSGNGFVNSKISSSSFQLPGSPKQANQNHSHVNSQGSSSFLTKPSAIRDLIRTEKVVKELYEGDYFGEIALILNTTRTCNVRAKTFCELNILERSDFEAIVTKYEEERKLMEEIIMEKYKVEAPSLEKHKRRSAENAMEVQQELIRGTSEVANECRGMVEVLSRQVELLTQALVASEVIRIENLEKDGIDGNGNHHHSGNNNNNGNGNGEIIKLNAQSGPQKQIPPSRGLPSKMPSIREMKHSESLASDISEFDGYDFDNDYDNDDDDSPMHAAAAASASATSPITSRLQAQAQPVQVQEPYRDRSLIGPKVVPVRSSISLGNDGGGRSSAAVREAQASHLDRYRREQDDAQAQAHALGGALSQPGGGKEEPHSRSPTTTTTTNTSTNSINTTTSTSTSSVGSPNSTSAILLDRMGRGLSLISRVRGNSFVSPSPDPATANPNRASPSPASVTDGSRGGSRSNSPDNNMTFQRPSRKNSISQSQINSRRNSIETTDFMIDRVVLPKSNININNNSSAHSMTMQAQLSPTSSSSNNGLNNGSGSGMVLNGPGEFLERQLVRAFSFKNSGNSFSGSGSVDGSGSNSNSGLNSNSNGGRGYNNHSNSGNSNTRGVSDALVFTNSNNSYIDNDNDTNDDTNDTVYDEGNFGKRSDNRAHELELGVEEEKKNDMMGGGRGYGGSGGRGKGNVSGNTTPATNAASTSTSASTAASVSESAVAGESEQHTHTHTPKNNETYEDLLKDAGVSVSASVVVPTPSKEIDSIAKTAAVLENSVVIGADVNSPSQDAQKPSGSSGGSSGNSGGGVSKSQATKQRPNVNTSAVLGSDTSTNTSASTSTNKSPRPNNNPSKNANANNNNNIIKSPIIKINSTGTSNSNTSSNSSGSMSVGGNSKSKTQETRLAATAPATATGSGSTLSPVPPSTSSPSSASSKNSGYRGNGGRKK